MFYSLSLVIPANTTARVPVRDTLTLTSGVIRRIHCRWWYGVGNLGGVRLKLHEFGIWPLSAGTWYPSHHEQIATDEEIAVDTDPGELVIEGYNLDTRYAHTVWIGVEVERETPLERLVTYLHALLGGG